MDTRDTAELRRHLLSFGSVCSRLEYDGFLEGLERSELAPPVHHCASQRCQRRQRPRQTR